LVNHPPVTHQEFAVLTKQFTTQLLMLLSEKV
jgi:hypothetical protein